MPTLDALDYERFTYDTDNDRPLDLDEAVKKAAEQRRTDPNNVYRVEPTDGAATGFRVESVPVASLYAEFVARIAQRMVRGKVTNKR